MDSEDDDPELGRPLVRNPVLFDAGVEQRPATDMPRAVQAVRDRDTQDIWAELG